MPIVTRLLKLNRRHAAWAVLAIATFTSPVVFAAAPHLATGIKIGEVTDHSAIVWTRLTRNADRNSADGPMVTIKYAKPEGRRQGAAPRASLRGHSVPRRRNGRRPEARRARRRWRSPRIVENARGERLAE